MQALDISIKPSPILFGAILVLHAAVIVALEFLAVPVWCWALPLASGLICGRQCGLLQTRSAAVRLRCVAGRWYWYQRDGRRSPPQRLIAGSRGSRYCLQLGFAPLQRSPWWRRRWLLLTPQMLGSANYRRLYVQLRWSAGAELPSVR